MDETVEEVARLPWVQAVRPVQAPYRERLSRYSDLIVWHLDVEFPEWPIPPAWTARWQNKQTKESDTWRKSPLAVGVDSGCEYSCGEVELAARLRNAGYDGFWVSEWCGFPHVSCWEPYCVKRNELKERAPTLLAFDQQLRASAVTTRAVLGTRGGHPDVGFWLPSTHEHLYIEYKGPGDSINAKQDSWAQAIHKQENSRLAYVVVRGRFTKML
jgi:hypothetical protein